LALALLLLLREHGDPLPAAAVCISPWTDLTLTLPSVVANAHLDSIVSAAMLGVHGKHYAGHCDPKLPFISPLYADLHSLPPLLIHVGSYEILLDDSIQLAERARGQGVDVTLYVADGLWHVWHIYANSVPEGQAAIEAIGRFVQSQF
jgi:acetyl esterase/lipase